MKHTTETPKTAVQILEQDGETLEGLLSKYSPVMYRAAFRRLGNAADAEDALQEALMSASRNITQFKGECHISTWLVAIAINAARMQLRRQLRHRTVSLEQPSEDGNSVFFYEPADDRPDPEQTYKGVEMRGIIGQLMTELSPPLRNAFRLRGLEGFSIQEAAEALDVTQGTLKAQYFRARARIRTLLQEPRRLSRAGRPRGRRVHRSACL